MTLPKRTPEPLSRGPRVSVGVPVYNGERYLSATLQSLLDQSFDDLEVVISDNASTDRTEEICRDYGLRDRRIRYFRSESNLGAAPNYNRTFELSTGTYFKWNAHDDLLAPTFLEKCVTALEADRDAVLCHTLLELIDEAERSLGTFRTRLSHADATRPSDRFAAVILPASIVATEFFGVIRRADLVGSLLHGTYHGSDRALLAQLALRGRLIGVEEPLFKLREHPERYTRAVPAAERRGWYQADPARQTRFPTWQLYRDYLTAVWGARVDAGDRRRCYRHLARWWFAQWNWARMLLEPPAALEPRLLSTAEAVKRRLFGHAPSAFVG